MVGMREPHDPADPVVECPQGLLATHLWIRKSFIGRSISSSTHEVASEVRRTEVEMRHFPVDMGRELSQPLLPKSPLIFKISPQARNL